MCRIFGLASCEVAPTYKTLLRFVHSGDRALLRTMVREAPRIGRHPSFDCRVIRPDGEIRSVHVRYEVLYDEAGRATGLEGTVHDITERKALEERLEDQAFHDSLTGLSNRALFMDRLGHALARVERYERAIAVLFMDLDDFKLVNDSFGHEVGNRLLAAVAERLQECVRPQDTIARIGGDEFTVLLEDVEDVDDAACVAERITEALRCKFHLGEDWICTGASVGVVLSTSARDWPESLLWDADLTMYEAKRLGKARYEVFNPGTNHRSARRLELKRDLGRALERGEFRVLYQPKMLLRTGGIIGTEALVRWEHPERGLISPSEFVPLAEETDFIIPIGYKVLEEACRQACAWQKRYPDAPQTMYINLSARQFNDPRLVGEVTKVVGETGVESDSLALEISENVLMSNPQSALDKLRLLRELGASVVVDTLEIAESILMDDPEANIKKLTALNDLGIHIVIDGFGTAYSSLSQLKNFPLNMLKIDRSLTVKLGEEPEDEAIVSAMIKLAQALGWAVTVQGVEDEEQLAILRNMGCDIVQGYYFTRPVTSEEATALLEADFVRQNVEA